MIVQCDCETCPPKRVLEIKCPYAMRECEPSAAPYLDEHGQLKETHKYYAQVQGQMFVTDLKECVFAVATSKGTHIVMVERDDHFLTGMLTSLKKYFVREVLPALLSR